jgi:hypothetical protein
MPDIYPPPSLQESLESLAKLFDLLHNFSVIEGTDSIARLMQEIKEHLDSDTVCQYAAML